MEVPSGIGEVRLVGLAIAVALVPACQGPGPDAAAPAGEVRSPALTATCATSVMNLVAHEDDDLLFISPDLVHAIGGGGTCVRTVFLTAGDAGQDQTYWSGREAGIKAAYAQMAGVANTWTQSNAAVPGQTVSLFTLAGNSAVSVAFMRLPDGLTDGSGF